VHGSVVVPQGVEEVGGGGLRVYTCVCENESGRYVWSRRCVSPSECRVDACGHIIYTPTHTCTHTHTHTHTHPPPAA
jgi:hypothetical protein